jgi:hypothetical protein
LYSNGLGEFDYLFFNLENYNEVAMYKTDLNKRRFHDFGGEKTPSGQTVVRKRQHFITFSANEFEKK